MGVGGTTATIGDANTINLQTQSAGGILVNSANTITLTASPSLIANNSTAGSILLAAQNGTTIQTTAGNSLNVTGGNLVVGSAKYLWIINLTKNKK